MIIRIIFSILITGVRPESEVSPPPNPCTKMVNGDDGFGLTTQDATNEFCTNSECQTQYGKNADNFLCLKDDDDKYCMPSLIQSGLLDETWYTRNFSGTPKKLDEIYNGFDTANWEGAGVNYTVQLATNYAQMQAGIVDLYYKDAIMAKIADLCSPCGKKLTKVAYNISKIFNKDYDICLVVKDGNLGDCLDNIFNAMALGSSVTAEDMKNIMALLPRFLNNPILCHPCFKQYVDDGILETPALASLPVTETLYNSFVCPPPPPTQAPTKKRTSGGSTLYLGTFFLFIPALVELFLM